MNTKQLSDFIEALFTKTTEKEVQWDDVDKKDLYSIVSKEINFSTVKGGFVSTNKEGTKKAILGKYNVKRYVDEEEFYYQDKYFLEINDTGNSKSILFNENELRHSDITKLATLYRKIELSNSGVEETLNNWF